MGSDSGNPSQASAGHGLARSASKLNLGGGSALGRSSSKVSLSGMAKGEFKPGLRRSPSRAQLNPDSETAKPEDAQPESAGPSAAPPAKPDSSSPVGTSTSSSPGPVPAAGAPSIAPPLLKRSHSMDHIDTVKAPAVSEGQKAVESITGKVALPIAPVRSIPGSQVPPGVPDADVSERGRVIQERQTAKAEQDSAIKAADSPSISPSSSAAAPPSMPRIEAPASAVKQASLSPAASPKSSATTLAPFALPPNLNLPSPRDDASALPEAEQRVDYFSHNWNESDIAGSWRYIISRRQDMANSARLENASWRMWAKAKNGLATVPPSTVNWLKDYDVTWLYGPLYHEPDSVYQGAQAAHDSRAGSISPGDECAAANMEATPPISKHGCYPKSILKKKTLAQLMLEDAHELEQNTGVPPHARTTTNYIRHHHYRPVPLGVNRQMVADILNQQYASVPSHDGPVATPGTSEPNSASDSAAGSETGSRSSTPGATPSRRPVSLRSLRSTRSGSLASLSTLERHVHFNDRVEQCVALDPEDADEAEPQRPKSLSPDDSKNSEQALRGEDEDEEDEDEDEDEDEEDNAGLFLGLRRPSVIDIKAHEHGCNIIASLPATTLKYDDEEDEDVANQRKEEAVTSMLSSSRRPGFNAHYQPHPVQTEKGPSYQIVDPTIRPVDFKADTAKAELDEAPPRSKVRPAASFG